jgi:undecaprenyl-diphosphatase
MRLQAFVLGIIQGLTEFLPVSSSGHLVLVESLLKINTERLLLIVIMHVGSLFAILFAAIRDFELTKKLSKRKFLNLVPPILIGTIPIAVIGFLFRVKLERIVNYPKLAGLFLIITGVVLFVTKYAKGTGKRLGLFDAFIMGIGQAFAILPGVSRSGATISTGMYIGLNRSLATEFSFLLAIPAIIGASIIELRGVVISSFDSTVLIIGGVTSFFVSYFAIRVLLSIVKKAGIHIFSYYCFAVGILTIVIL